jgi:hypothetical protein
MALGPVERALIFRLHALVKAMRIRCRNPEKSSKKEPPVVDEKRMWGSINTRTENERLRQKERRRQLRCSSRIRKRSLAALIKLNGPQGL